jgi:hypothetical protein
LPSTLGLQLQRAVAKPLEPGQGLVKLAHIARMGSGRATNGNAPPPPAPHLASHLKPFRRGHSFDHLGGDGAGQHGNVLQRRFGVLLAIGLQEPPGQQCTCLVSRQQAPLLRVSAGHGQAIGVCAAPPPSRPTSDAAV